MKMGIKGELRSIHKHPQKKSNNLLMYMGKSTTFFALKEFDYVFLRLASSPK